MLHGALIPAGDRHGPGATRRRWSKSGALFEANVRVYGVRKVWRQLGRAGIVLARCVEPSVGSVVDSYDNALAETIDGLFKAEVIHRRGPWRSFEAVEFATLDWFNTRRLLEPIGNIPPAEAEAHYYAKTEGHASAA